MMSSAMPGTSDRKGTRRPGRKAPTLRSESNTSGTAGGRVVNIYKFLNIRINVFLAICPDYPDLTY